MAEGGKTPQGGKRKPQAAENPTFVFPTPKHSLRHFSAPFSSMSARGASNAPRGSQLPAQEKVSNELFTLTYGAMVRQLLHDFETVEEVNAELDAMGARIGSRLVDDFLANAQGVRCADFKSAADSVARVGFRSLLGVTARVGAWSETSDAGSGPSACSIYFEENPITDFVELPRGLEELSYCNVLCGVIRGALEQIGMHVTVVVVKDMLKGADGNELRLTLKEHAAETYPFKDDD